MSFLERATDIAGYSFIEGVTQEEAEQAILLALVEPKYRETLLAWLVVSEVLVRARTWSFTDSRSVVPITDGEHYAGLESSDRFSLDHNLYSFRQASGLEPF